MELLPFPILLVLFIGSALLLASSCTKQGKGWLRGVAGCAALISLMFAGVQLVFYALYWGNRSRVGVRAYALNFTQSDGDWDIWEKQAEFRPVVQLE